MPDKTPTPEFEDAPTGDAGSLVLRDPSLVGNTVRASWPFSLDTIRANIAKCRPEAKDALIAAFRWSVDPRHPITLREFASKVGHSYDTLYKLYTGKYIHPATRERLDAPLDLVKKIQQFLELERERAEGGDVEFVMIPTAKRIWTGADLARESRTIVLVGGPSHVGKSFAAEKYTSGNNHGRTVYCRMEAACGLGGMVRAVAAAIGISDKGNTAHLIKRIKGGLTPEMLLILDEMHLLAYTYRRESFFACIELLREFHDVTKCGQLQLWTRIDLLESAKDKEMQQVWRRGVHKIILGPPTRGDVAAILAHNGLTLPARDLEVTVSDVTDRPFDILRQLAKQSGLKAITERIRYARKLAGKRSDKVDWKHFLDAHLRILSQASPVDDWGRKDEVAK